MMRNFRCERVLSFGSATSIAKKARGHRDHQQRPRPRQPSPMIGSLEGTRGAPPNYTRSADPNTTRAGIPQTKSLDQQHRKIRSKLAHWSARAEGLFHRLTQTFQDWIIRFFIAVFRINRVDWIDETPRARHQLDVAGFDVWLSNP